MKISFNILTFNSSHVLRESLMAIIDAVRASGVTWEINVLNNGSKDDTEEVVKSFKENQNILLLNNRENRAFTEGYNKLLKIARGDVYLIISDDVIIDKSLINHVICTYSEGRNQKMVLAPKTVLPDGRRDNINKIKLGAIDLLVENTLVSNVLRIRRKPLNQDVSCEAEVLQDSCLIFTQYVKKEVVYDEDLKFYFTEDQLCKRLKDNGATLKYDTSVSVTHYLKQATKKQPNVKMNSIYIKDCIMYSRKYMNRWYHEMLFRPLMVVTHAVKYIKWSLNKEDYL